MKKKKKKKKRRRRVVVSFKQMRDSVVAFHKRNGLPYTMKFTNSNAYLDSDQGYYMTNATDFPMSELIYIQMFKNHIIDSGKYKKVKKINKKEIRYYAYNDKIKAGSSFGECYEIDLKSAYWEIANDMGLIEEKLYRKTTDINPKTGKVYMSKPTRLAAVGSLAKSETVIFFNGRKEKELKTITSPLTKHIWDHICLKVGKSMARVAKMSKNDFIFFWVDAIFVNSEKSKNLVERILKRENFHFKTKKIRNIKFDQKRIWVRDNSERRPFPYTQKQSTIKFKKNGNN